MTSLITTDESIIKTDSVGRVRNSPERREQLLNEFERSGLSGAKFAALTGVRYSTFATWVARRRKARSQSEPQGKAADSVRWLEAVVSAAAAPAHTIAPTLKLRLPGGAWMELSQPDQVSLAAALVQALERPVAAC